MYEAMHTGMTNQKNQCRKKAAKTLQKKISKCKCGDEQKNFLKKTQKRK